jgi:RNA polymerase sigma factor FliA
MTALKTIPLAKQTPDTPTLASILGHKPLKRPRTDMTPTWLAFIQEGKKSPTLRAAIVDHYMHLVVIVARRYFRSNPHVEHGVYVSDGYMGLEKAIDLFDIERGFKFETFAPHKILGAIKDATRKRDITTRNNRRASNTHKDVLWAAKTKAGLGDKRNMDELIIEAAADRGIDEHGWKLIIKNKDYAKAPQDVNYMYDNTKGERNQEHIISTDEVVKRGPQASNEDITYFQQVMARYPNARDRRIAAVYLFGDDKMKSSGDILDLSESRMSQIMNNVLGFLVQYLDETLNGGIPSYYFRLAGVPNRDMEGLFNYARQNRSSDKIRALFALAQGSQAMDSSVSQFQAPPKETPDTTPQNGESDLKKMYLKLKARKK